MVAIPTLSNYRKIEQPEQIGRYLLKEQLGKGSMANVFRAYDPKIDRTLAIKILRQERLVDDDYRLRFLREAKAAGTLSHPGIVTIYDVGESNDTPFIAMERIEGVPLDVLLRNLEKLPVKQVITLGIQIAEALDFAHSRGIIHRDIKPSNIILNQETGKVKITDFGIARINSSQVTQHTQIGDVIGTPQYMAPEQVLGKTIDARTDLFSLGVILYEMLMGTKPFRGDVLATLFFHIATENPKPFPVTRTDIPSALKQTVDKLLKKQADKRFQSGREVANALGSILADLEHKHQKKNAESVSIHFKWSLLVSMFSALFLSMMGYIFFHQQSEFIKSDALRYGEAISNMLATDLAEPLLREDQTDLELIADEMIKKQNISYLSISNHHGQTVFKFGSDPENIVFTPSSTNVEVSFPTIGSERNHALYKSNIEYSAVQLGRVTLGLPANDYLASQKNLLVLCLISGSILLLFISITSYLFSKMLSYPINTLLKGINEINQGHFSYRIGTTRKDEFGKLFTAFDNMANKIQKEHEAQTDKKNIHG